MIPEVVIAQLALGKLGAIYTPIFSGFGAEAVAARLQDCEARLLITCDGIPRRGKLVTTKEFADEAVARWRRASSTCWSSTRPTHRHAVAAPARHLVA